MLTQGKAKYPITEIILHCSATRPDWMEGKPSSEKFAEIRRWHMQDRGWRDIGYHWVIDRDGTIMQGRKMTEIGAHVAGHNAGTIGICLIGGAGSSADDEFHEHFTYAQDRAARQIIASIRLNARITKISGHNEYAAKACPGFRVAAWRER